MSPLQAAIDGGTRQSSRREGDYALATKLVEAADCQIQRLVVLASPAS